MMNENKIKIRFFFDAWAGICFWSGNDKAHEKFGDYPIEIDDLPLSENLKDRLNYLLNWFEAGVDENYPWSEKEDQRFNSMLKKAIEEVIVELGLEYEIVHSLHE